MDLWSCPDGDVGETIDRFWSNWPNLHRGPLAPATVQAIAEDQSSEQLKNEVSPQLRNWLRILDEVNGWLIGLYIEVRSLADKGLMDGSPDSGLGAQFLAMYYVLGRIVSDGQAIKVLTLNGCEYQSRVLLRSTIEHLDLMAAIINDNSLAEHFMKAGSEDAANSFWHKFVSKGKLKKRPLALMSKFPGLGDWWDDFRRSEDEMHSIFSHPNVTAAFVLNMLSDEKLLDPQMVYVRRISSISIRTIRFFVLHVMSIVWSSEDRLVAVINGLEGRFEVLGVPIRKEFGELLYVGKLALAGLFVFLIGNMNADFLDLDLSDVFLDQTEET